MSVPPFFDRVVPERACTRGVNAVGDPCGAEAFLHVAWRDAAEGIESGYVCTAHAPELAHWPPLVYDGVPQIHEPGPDCGIPGACWFLEENVCRVPDESEPIEARTADRVPLTIGAEQSDLPR